LLDRRGSVENFYGWGGRGQYSVFWSSSPSPKNTQAKNGHGRNSGPISGFSRPYGTDVPLERRVPALKRRAVFRRPQRVCCSSSYAPSGLVHFPACFPTACAVGFILAPLRGWAGLCPRSSGGRRLCRRSAAGSYGTWTRHFYLRFCPIFRLQPFVISSLAKQDPGAGSDCGFGARKILRSA